MSQEKVDKYKQEKYNRKHATKKRNVKKIAEQISAIAFTAPHMLHMEKEFALLQEAAKRAFRAEYPNREHFLKKL